MKLLCFLFFIVLSFNLSITYAETRDMGTLSCEELKELNERLHSYIRELEKDMSDDEIEQKVNSCYQRGLANIPPSELLDFCTLAGEMVLSDIHYSVKCGD